LFLLVPIFFCKEFNWFEIELLSFEFDSDDVPKTPRLGRAPSLSEGSLTLVLPYFSDTRLGLGLPRLSAGPLLVPDISDKSPPLGLGLPRLSAGPLLVLVPDTSDKSPPLGLGPNLSGGPPLVPELSDKRPRFGFVDKFNPFRLFLGALFLKRSSEGVGFRFNLELELELVFAFLELLELVLLELVFAFLELLELVLLELVFAFLELLELVLLELVLLELVFTGRAFGGRFPLVGTKTPLFSFIVRGISIGSVILSA